MSFERSISGLEVRERETLTEQNQSIPLHQSISSFLWSYNYLNTLGPILDWSSLDQDSPTYKATVKTEAQALMVKYLAKKTKNQPTLLKVS